MGRPACRLDRTGSAAIGLLVDPDPAAVAEAMITLLDPETADEMDAAAARHAAQGASWSGVVEKAVAAYRSALADPTEQDQAEQLSRRPATRL